ncbi:hypothetical protein DVH05_014548 [Phytophthora capsici]|nr:hypothetical protein DVH05_014548 [Phytophthora capsici]|eukprot:jgi/Phyca11/13936/fgenesh1_pg.PHYCAscaffold_5_\
MRLSYVVIPAAIAVTFASSGNALAAADGSNTGLSAITSPNVVASIDTAVGGEKRSLRYHTNEDLEDDSDDEGLDDAEEEERRGNNMFSTTKLDEMLDGTQLMSRFKKWQELKYNMYNLPDTILASKYDELRKMYRRFLYYN